MDQFTQFSHTTTMALYGFALLLGLLGAKIGPPKLGRVLTVATAGAGLGLQVTLLVARWTAVGYLPVTGLFSTLHFLAIFMVAVTLYFVWRYEAATLLPGVMVLALFALLKAGGGDMALKPLVPALDTPLFFLHVSTSFAAYGLFAVAALIAIYRTVGMPASALGMERRMIDECLYIGYILFSWCMIAGSLWAYLAWGSYWTWRIKGLWSTILWFYYSGVIHIRNRPRWHGWPLNLLTIAGFALVLFTFLGLGLLFETSHPLK
jgi:ABC-type transport system involved in cytochrome c biogenesis permease subunit